MSPHLLLAAAFTFSMGCVAELPDEPEGTSEAEQTLVVGGCRLYRDANFLGPWLFIPTDRDFNDLHRVNGFGDITSSVDCAPGVSLRVFVDSNFGGTSFTVLNNASNLATVGMDDRISSVSWTLNRTGTCTFFVNSNFGPPGFIIQADRDHNDMHRTSPAFGDNISSVSCTAGAPAVTVCKNDSWTGSCTSLSGSVANLASIGFGDNISSVVWF